MTDFTGSLHFTSSDPLASPILDAAFVPANLGVKTVSVQFGTAGTQSISAADTVRLTIAGSASTLVLHGTSARLVLSGLPGSAVAGSLLTPTVTAVDVHGNVVTDFSGTVHFASTDTAAQIPADFVFTAANLGAHTFPVVLYRAATTSITISSTGLPAATASIVVAHAAVAQVTLEGLPAATVVDVLQNVTVTARDAFGNVVTDYAGTLHFVNSDAQASVIPDAAFTVANPGARVFALQFGTAGTQSLSATDTIRPTVTGSASILVLHGAAARLAITGFPASTVAGGLLTPTVTAVDVHGNAVTDFAGTVHFAATDLAAQLPADFAFTAGALGSHTFPVVLKTAATSTVTVTSTGLPAATTSVVVSHAAATQVTLAGLLAQVVVDVVQTVTATVRDAYGNPLTDYTGTLHFTSSDAQAVLPADAIFVPADLGAKAVAVRFGLAGTQSLSARDTVATAIVGSASTLVLHGPATRLALAGLPAATASGTVLTPTVTAVDAHGNLVTDFAGTVHFASTDSTAQLPADFTFTALDAGSHTFSVLLRTAATSTVTVTAAGLTAATASVVVTRGAATQVTFAGLQAQVVVDAIQTVTATIRDAFGNPVTDYTGTLHFTSSDAQAVLPADAIFVPADLGAKAVSVRFGIAGTQSFSARDTVATAVAGSASTLVLRGPASQLVLSGLPAATVAGTPLTVAVTAADAHGNIVTDFTGTVHFTSTDATAQLPADFTFTVANAGSRTFPVLLTAAATSTVTVATPGLPAATASVVVSRAAATQVTLTGLPAQVVADAVQTVTAAVRDAFGNPVTDYTGTLHFTSSDAQAVLPADAILMLADLGAKAVTVRFGVAGTQSLSARDTVATAIAGSASTLVLHGPATQLVLSGLPAATVAGTPLTMAVTAADAHGNLATDFAGTVHFTSTDTTAQLPADFTFTAANVGSRTFSIVLTRAATSGISVSTAGLPVASANVVVRHAALSLVSFAGLPAQAVASVVQTLTVTVRDAFGNPGTDYTGILRFANTDPLAPPVANATFTLADLGSKSVSVQFGTVGTQTLSATDTVNLSMTGSASTLVLNGPAARLVLTGIGASAVAGALQTATVTAVDALGNVATDFIGTVHFASIDLAAQLPPDAAFIATDKGVRSFSLTLTTVGPRSVTVSQVGGGATAATVNVAVSNAPASQMTLVAHATQVAVDTNAVFTVTLRDRFGNPALDYLGAVHFVSSDLNATTIPNVTFTPAMFATTDVTLRFATAGQQSLLANDTINAAISTSAVINVTNGAASSYLLSALPSTAFAGDPLPLVITVVDAHGNPVLGYAGSAAVTSSDPSDRLPVAGAFVNGVRNVSLSFVTTGLHRATVNEVAGTISVSTLAVNIVSGNAATLAVVNASVTAGVALSTNVVAKDTFGNTVGSYAGTVRLTSTDALAVLPVAYTYVGLDAGQHSFPVTLKTAGAWTVTATDAAAISGSATFTVAPAAASSCDLAIIGKTATQVALRVKALDPFSNLASGYRGTVSLSSSDPAAQLPLPTAYTATDAGSHDFTAVVPTAGDQTIRATDATTPFACQAIITIAGGQFFAVTFAGPEAWAGTPRPVTVQAQDAAGTPIANYAGTIVFSSSDTAAALPASVTLVGTEGGHATANVTFNSIGVQTFTAKDSANATRTGTAFQTVHGLSYTNPAMGGKVRLILNAAASTASVVQLDLVSNTSLFPLGVTDPLNSSRVLPSSVRNGVFAAGMNLPLDTTKVGPDAQLLRVAPPASAILSLGLAPQAVGAAFANGILYSGISQKRYDLTVNCTPSCTNDSMRGDVPVRPFPGATSPTIYYSLRLKLTPGAPAGTIFDGQALASDKRFRAAARDRSGLDVFSGTTDFAIGRLEMR